MAPVKAAVIKRCEDENKHQSNSVKALIEDHTEAENDEEAEQREVKKEASEVAISRKAKPNQRTRRRRREAILSEKRLASVAGLTGCGMPHGGSVRKCANSNLQKAPLEDEDTDSDMPVLTDWSDSEKEDVRAPPPPSAVPGGARRNPSRNTEMTGWTSQR